MDDKNLERDLELIGLIMRGNEMAREELLRKYTPLVKHIVRRYVTSALEFDDLFQEGLIGLLSAIGEYDYQSFGVKFSSFAYLCVIRRVFNVIRQSNNSKQKALNSAISLQSCLGLDDGRMLLDAQRSLGPDPEQSAEQSWIDAKLDQTLQNHLSSLEYLVVSLLAGGYGMREIETRLGISAKAVDNARTRARLKIRRLVERHGSLLSASVPAVGRRRLDLCIDVRMAADT